MQQKLDQRVKTVDRLEASLQELQHHLQLDGVKLDGLQVRLNERESRCEQLERKLSILHQEKNDLMSRTGNYLISPSSNRTLSTTITPNATYHHTSNTPSNTSSNTP